MELSAQPRSGSTSASRVRSPRATRCSSPRKPTSPRVSTASASVTRPARDRRARGGRSAEIHRAHTAVGGGDARRGGSPAGSLQPRAARNWRADGAHLPELVVVVGGELLVRQQVPGDPLGLDVLEPARAAGAAPARRRRCRAAGRLRQRRNALEVDAAEVPRPCAAARAWSARWSALRRRRRVQRPAPPRDAPSRGERAVPFGVRGPIAVVVAVLARQAERRTQPESGSCAPPRAVIPSHPQSSPPKAAHCR